MYLKYSTKKLVILRSQNSLEFQRVGDVYFKKPDLRNSGISNDNDMSSYVISYYYIQFTYLVI